MSSKKIIPNRHMHELGVYIILREVGAGSSIILCFDTKETIKCVNLYDFKSRETNPYVFTFYKSEQTPFKVIRYIMDFEDLGDYQPSNVELDVKQFQHHFEEIREKIPEFFI